MPTLTLRPDNTAYAGVNVTVVGAADADNALKDNSVGSYVAVGYGTYGSFAVDLHLDDTDAIPANAIITRIRARVFSINVSALDNFDGSFLRGYFGDNFRSFLGYAFSTQGQGIDSTTAIEMAGPWLTQRIDGEPWTRANLDDTRLKLELIAPNSSDPGQHGHIYEAYVDVEYNMPPTLAVVAPANGSFIEVGAPQIHWAFTDTDGDAQTYARVRIFTAAQVAAGGFNPQYSASYVESAWLSGTLSSWQAPALANGSYRVYVIAQQGPGALDTGWGNYTNFSIVALDIAPPTIHAVPEPYSSAAAVWLSVLAGMNLLPLDDGAFELTTGTMGWTGGTGVRTTAAGEFRTGVGGFRLTSTGAGTPFLFSTALTNIVAGKLYRVRAWVRSNVVRQILPSISWYNAGGGLIATTLDFSGTAVGPIGLGFIDVRSPVWVAPPGATSAKVGFTWAALGAGEICYFDDVGLVPAQIQNAVWDEGNHSFFEATTGYWAPKENGQPAVRTVAGGTFFSGTGALKMQAVAAGDMKYWPFQTYGGGIDTHATAVHESARKWKIRAVVKAAATNRVVKFGYEAQGVNGQSLLVDEADPGNYDSPSGHVLLQREIVVPVGTRRLFPYIIVEGCAAGEIHYVDEFLVWQVVDWDIRVGRGGLWPPGSYQDPDVSTEVQASYDGGATWATLPAVNPFEWWPGDVRGDANQSAFVRDWAAPPNQTAYYRARTTVDVGSGLLISDWGYSPPVIPVGTGAFLKDPYTEQVVPVALESFSRRYVEEQTTHYPAGRAAAVVVSEGPKGDVLSLALRTLNADERNALEPLIRSGRPLLFVNTLGEVWWIKIMDGGDAEVVRAQPNQGDLYGIRDFYRYQLTAVEVVPPDLS